MRTSKRTDILEAALRVIDRGGVTAVTFESVAEESGMTKGGLLYHFPTREALLRAIHEHLAARWEATLLEELHGTPDASPEERLAAYVRVATARATRTELLLMLETANDPELHRPWHDLIERWTPPAPTGDELSPAELDQLIARLAADGLWVSDALSSIPLRPAARRQLAEVIAQRVLGAASEATKK